MKNLVFFCLVIMLLPACENPKSEVKPDPALEEDLIRQSIENSIGWIREKDTALLYSIIADDVNYLEVHPANKVVVGIKQFKEAEAFWLDDRFTHVGFETWDMRINLSQDGSVAWFYCMLNDLNDWSGSPVNWENTRWTGVLEKRDGKWRMVQMHFSKATE